MEEIIRELIIFFSHLSQQEVLGLTWPKWMAQVLAVLSLFVSPILAIYAFYRNGRIQRELIQEGRKAQEAKTMSEVAQRKAREKGIEAEARAHEVKVLQDDLRRITDGKQKLWNLRGNNRFPEYYEWKRNPEGARIVTVGNLKGGVGKTTLAANLAAYFQETFHKKVLLIDLDYQGSLSNSLMQASGSQVVDSQIDRLFEPNASVEQFFRARHHLAPLLCRGDLVTANYPFAEVDSRLLMNWLLPVDGIDRTVDVRYRLAKVLLNPAIRQEYGLIVLDMSPRLTVGAVNALVASDAFIVPTVLDNLSIEAVPSFLGLMDTLRADLEIDLLLAGVVPTLSQMTNLQPREKLTRERLKELLEPAWENGSDLVTAAHLPRIASIAYAVGEGLPYLKTKDMSAQVYNTVLKHMNGIYAELLTRIGFEVPTAHQQIVEEFRKTRGEPVS